MQRLQHYQPNVPVTTHRLVHIHSPVLCAAASVVEMNLLSYVLINVVGGGFGCSHREVPALHALTFWEKTCKTELK